MSESRMSQSGLTTQSISSNCKLCDGIGFVTWNDSEGRLWAKRCSCQDADNARRILEASGLAEEVKRRTFDSFRTETGKQTEMKQKARKYVDAVTNLRDYPFRPWFFVGGNPGAGKTHICTAICGELLKRNIPVKYMQWLNDARRLKSVVNDDSFDRLAGEYIDIPVLYIDDLLKQKYTSRPEFTEADIKVAFTILNGRYLKNKPTIISSEWEMEGQLLPADEGIFSRVFERCRQFVINIPRDDGNNYRFRPEVLPS